MAKLLSLIAILTFLLALQTVEAFSVGTVVKKDVISIKSGESAKFTILFWSVENESYEVKLEVKEVPEEWLVIIQPKEFVLNSSTGEEYINLDASKGIKALPVSVFVKPENAKTGKYFIIIGAKAGSPEEGVSFFQERQFKLNVDVMGSQIQEEDKNKIPNVVEELRPLTGELVAPISSKYIFYLVILVCILVISLLIYKYV